VEKHNNKPLASWVDSVWDGLEENARLAIAIPTSTIEMTKLRSGFFAKEIFDNAAKQFKDPSSVPAMFGYSAHYDTIANMLSLLGAFNPNSPIPEYASALLIDVRSINNTPHLEVSYKTSNTKPAAPVNIPGCGVSCPLSKVLELVKAKLPVNSYSTECKAPANYVPPKEDIYYYE